MCSRRGGTSRLYLGYTSAVSRPYLGYLSQAAGLSSPVGTILDGGGAVQILRTGSQSALHASPSAEPHAHTPHTRCARLAREPTRGAPPPAVRTTGVGLLDAQLTAHKQLPRLRSPAHRRRLRGAPEHTPVRARHRSLEAEDLPASPPSLPPPHLAARSPEAEDALLPALERTRTPPYSAVSEVLNARALPQIHALLCATPSSPAPEGGCTRHVGSADQLLDADARAGAGGCVNSLGALVLQALYLGCTSAASRLDLGYTSAVSRLHLGYASAGSRLHLGWTSAASRLYLGYTSAVSRLHLGYTSAASRLFLGYTSAVSRLHLGWTSAVSRLDLGCASAIPRPHPAAERCDAALQGRQRGGARKRRRRDHPR